MLKLKILSVGKTKEKWLEEAFQEYKKRLQPYLQIEICWAKDSEQLSEWCEKEPRLIALDPQGMLQTSEEFSAYLYHQWEKFGARLAIVIGGAEGLPKEIKNSYPLISLSKLTFTHQLTRLVLIEQVYRAIEINRGSPYHK
jgi:23S rRNA (pseudouridine1915-N3)-methyltransferase